MTSRNLLNLICSLSGAIMLAAIAVSNPAAADGPLSGDPTKLMQGA